MSLGREDLVLDGATTIGDVDRLVRPLRIMWPQAVAAQVDRRNGAVIPLSGPAWTTVRRWTEFFICDRDESLRSWIDHGATRDNANTMVHILVRSDSLTAVVDDPESLLARLILDIFAAIRYEREIHPGRNLRNLRAA